MQNGVLILYAKWFLNEVLYAKWNWSFVCKIVFKQFVVCQTCLVFSSKAELVEDRDLSSKGGQVLC